jgi:hypothetical protein
VDPEALETDPEGHGRQELWPATFWYDPGEHKEQLDEFLEEELPGGQLVHMLSVEESLY